MTGYLWVQRPSWLVDIITTSFEMVSNPSFSGYHILASEEYAFGSISGTDLVVTCVEDQQELAVPFRLLDIGAGEGRFLAAMRRRWDSQRLNAVAVSAFVYNAELAATAAFEARTLNAECLLDSKAFQADLRSGVLYNCILSAETFRHFQDPLGTLCQIFMLLQSGGVLAVDRLHVTGLGSGQRLLDWWQNAGFEVHGEASGERIAPLLLRRSSADQVLRVPVCYSEERANGSSNSSTSAVYVWSENATAECEGNDCRATSGAFKLSPPWSRIQNTNKAPPAQWRQMEGLLRQLARK
jgi:2-polyprenyl-3-methyl-5-hydroxy-6-metoxy-1,4-benzoquinol methylase